MKILRQNTVNCSVVTHFYLSIWVDGQTEEKLIYEHTTDQHPFQLFNGPKMKFPCGFFYLSYTLSLLMIFFLLAKKNEIKENGLRRQSSFSHG